MSGIKLAELDASDMLDVIHYFFEEDSHFVSEAQADTRNSLRVSMYGTMYKRPYNYSTSRTRPQSRTFNAEGDIDEQFIADNKELKPFVPATDFDPESTNPFGTLLDSPNGY